MCHILYIFFKKQHSIQKKELKQSSEGVSFSIGLVVKKKKRGTKWQATPTKRLAKHNVAQ
jgi:hypothetical protein